MGSRFPAKQTKSRTTVQKKIAQVGDPKKKTGRSGKQPATPIPHRDGYSNAEDQTLSNADRSKLAAADAAAFISCMNTGAHSPATTAARSGSMSS